MIECTPAREVVIYKRFKKKNDVPMSSELNSPENLKKYLGVVNTLYHPREIKRRFRDLRFHIPHGVSGDTATSPCTKIQKKNYSCPVVHLVRDGRLTAAGAQKSFICLLDTRVQFGVVEHNSLCFGHARRAEQVHNEAGAQRTCANPDKHKRRLFFMPTCYVCLRSALIYFFWCA